MWAREMGKFHEGHISLALKTDWDSPPTSSVTLSILLNFLGPPFIHL